jgi:hypothetical protein
MQMTELSEEEWIAAVRRIRHIDPKLADAFECYCFAFRDKLKKPPICVMDTYSFGQLMFDAGEPQRSEPSKRFEPIMLHGGDPNAQHEGGYPLGIIIGGNAEVTDFVYGAGVPRGVPQAILKPGDFVGSFEFMDQFSGSKPKVVPDWMITAGASNIRFASNTNNKSFAKHLVRNFSARKKPEQAIRTARPFLEQLKKVERISNCLQKCKTEIIYFGTDWFAPLSDDNVDKDLAAAGYALMQIIGSHAWRASARIRPSASRAAQFFFMGRKFSRPELHERQRAFNIFNSLYDLFTGRRPMFVPEREKEPFREICEVLKGYNKDDNPFILRPDYPGETESRIGFMPVEDIASDLVESSGAHQSALMGSLHTIDEAVKLVPKSRRSILHVFGAIIQALSVRAPAGTMDDEAKGVMTYDIRQHPKDGIVLDDMSERQFFEAAGISLAKPGAQFFKTCIRLVAQPLPKKGGC